MSACLLATAASLVAAVQAAPAERDVPTATLSDGAQLPLVGLGTAFANDDCSEASDVGVKSCAAYNATLRWLRLGNKMVDTATQYCNHGGVGMALRDSRVPRDDVYLISKVDTWQMGYERTLAAAKNTLWQLGVDYLDLFLIHWRAEHADAWPQRICGAGRRPDEDNLRPPPCYDVDRTWQTCRRETWKAMVQLKQEGLVRSIGVSNFEIADLQELIADGVELPVVNQVEAHVGWHQDDLKKFAEAHKIRMMAASPMGCGTLQLHDATGQTNPLLVKIAALKGKSAAQVAQKYLVQKGYAIIPKTGNPAHMAQNIDLFSWQLSGDEMRQLGRVAFTCVCKYAKAGTQKCWMDPSTLMCISHEGEMLRCP